MSKKVKDCFVIGPIGEEKGEIRERSDKVLKYIIEPALEECGYKATRADQMPEPGIISSQIITRLAEDPLVIADLTGRNPNVYYELALRHTIKKPVVQIIDNSESLPFDIAATRTIKFTHTDLESADNARKEIIKQIKAIEKNPEDVDNPISSAINITALQKSHNPEDAWRVQITELLKEILSDVRITKARTQPELLSSRLKEKGFPGFGQEPYIQRSESEPSLNEILKKIFSEDKTVIGGKSIRESRPVLNENDKKKGKSK